jgi:putative hydrolase of the HAD superfamily
MQPNGTSRVERRQHLLIDADDTLWENNIYFELAFDDFVTFLDHEHLTSTEIQAILDEFQIVNRAAHGYGARSFARSLREAFIRITGMPDDHPDATVAERLGLRILDQQFDIIDGVIETLDALRPHHDLLMLTKGHNEEQRAKVERSGIGHLFDSILISDEKDERTYRSAVERHHLDPAHTWMIGNSPRSDINPALQAGINAIFIPHPRTWHLEVEALASDKPAGRELIHLESFRELLGVFESNASQPRNRSGPR